MGPVRNRASLGLKFKRVGAKRRRRKEINSLCNILVIRLVRRTRRSLIKAFKVLANFLIRPILILLSMGLLSLRNGGKPRIHC